MDNYRPPTDFYFLRMAELVSERGTCARRKVGCVFVNKKNQIVFLQQLFAGIHIINYSRVQKSKKTSSKRGMRRSHDSLTCDTLSLIHI